ncbi:MAG: CRTAC1 family protein [Bryobacteraceae bacterium]
MGSASISRLLLLSLLAGSLGESAAPHLRFTDIAEQAGLAGFVNKQGTTKKDYILESVGGGAAFFDYDKDGWLDIALVRGADLESYRKGGEPVVSLYRNNGDSTFTDVSGKAGLLNASGWGMGITVADYNEDGYDDIFVTGYGRNFLFRNSGPGTFAEVAREAGLLSEGLWSTGAVFFDANQDGRLDLYVSRYIKFDASRPIPRSARCKFKGMSVFCGPQGLESELHSLYQGNKDGRFSDVSETAGIREAEPPFHGLGVIALDYNNDGRMDLYVGNDSCANMLWRNEGGGRFVDVAVEAGVAFSSDGMEQASMGVEAGDLRNRGLLDIVVTNFSGETHEIYRNSPQYFLEDVTWDSGLGAPTLPALGWSTHMADFDMDGWLDIFIVNGHVYPEVDTRPVGTTYRQKAMWFRNLKNGKFEEIAGFADPLAGRGAATGDFDNDGDLDIVINNIDGPPALLRNEGIPGMNWLQIGAPLGARVWVKTQGLTQMREISSASGYLSSSSRRAYFGLGSASKADEVSVSLPDGRKQTRLDVRANQIIDLTSDIN